MSGSRMERIAEEADDVRGIAAPTPGQSQHDKQDDSEDATAVFAAQERDSHAQIDEMLQIEDVYTVSTVLRCEMQDFLLDAEAPDVPNGEDGAKVEDTLSDTSAYSESSVQFLLASTVQKPEVPQGWKTALAKCLESTPASASVSFSSSSPNDSQQQFTPGNVKIELLSSPELSSISSGGVRSSHAPSPYYSTSSDNSSQVAFLTPSFTTASGQKKRVLALIPRKADQNTVPMPIKHSSFSMEGKSQETPDKPSTEEVPYAPCPLSYSQQDISSSQMVKMSTPAPPRYAGPAVLPAVKTTFLLTKTFVVKLYNLPWAVTVDDILQLLGADAARSLVPQSQQIVAVHILCDRFKGRTKAPAFVEFQDARSALDAVAACHNKQMKGRVISVHMGSRKALMREIFPTWASSALSDEPNAPVVSSFELEGLEHLCRLQAPFASQTPERPYMNILSIAAKYPWRSTDLLASESEEQVRVLRTIRAAYKLLIQYGRRIPNLTQIKELFITFLERHGGPSGSLVTFPLEVYADQPSLTSRLHLGKGTGRHLTEPIALELASPVAPPPSRENGTSSSEESSSLNLSSETSGSSKEKGKQASGQPKAKAVIEALLNAQIETARRDLAALKASVEATPETSPEARLPVPPPAPKRDPAVRIIDFATPHRNAVTARSLKETNEAYDREKQRKRRAERTREAPRLIRTADAAEDGASGANLSNVTNRTGGDASSRTGSAKANGRVVGGAGGLGRNLSNLSMDSQASSQNMGKSTASSPMTVEKTGKIESLFTPPRCSLPTQASRDNQRKEAGSNGKATSSADGRKAVGNESTKKDKAVALLNEYGMSKEDLIAVLQKLLSE